MALLAQERSDVHGEPMCSLGRVFSSGLTSSSQAVSRQHHDLQAPKQIMQETHPHSLVVLAQGDEQPQGSLLTGPGLGVVQHGVGEQRRLHISTSCLVGRLCIDFFMEPALKTRLDIPALRLYTQALQSYVAVLTSHS